MESAVLIHLVISTFAAMALSMLLGSLSMSIAVISLLIGTIAGVITWRYQKDQELQPQYKFVPALLCGFVLFVALQHFLYLLYYDRHALKTLHLNNFGDLTLHIQYIRHLANGASFWPENPGFTGDILRYPIGMDLYNALWETLKVPLDSHLFVVGIIMTAITISMLYRWMGWLGVGAFFLNGGMANWAFLHTGKLHDLQNSVAWKNFLLSLWITQRGFLFAVPAGVYVIKMITESLLDERTLRREEKIICTVLWSALAWFHLHTFFIISLTLGICIILYKKLRSLLGMLIPVAIIGLLFIWISTDGFTKAEVIHLQWGWVSGEENFFNFLLQNLGPWLLLGIISLVLLAKKSFLPLRPLTLVFFLLFSIFTFVMVAPWDWDNIKVLLWLYLMIVWLAWKMWVKRLPTAAALSTGCILFFSGAISLISSLPGNAPGAQLYKMDEVWESKAALKTVPIESVLAVVPDPNHPAMFWGMKVAMGYPGHLWTHGIDYGDRENKLDKIFKGDPDWFTHAGEIGVTHIYWGKNEQEKYRDSNPLWQNELKNISLSSKIKIYDVHRYKNP